MNPDENPFWGEPTPTDLWDDMNKLNNLYDKLQWDHRDYLEFSIEGNHITKKWKYKCAYCGSNKELTIDHVVPRSKGGTDFTKNVVCCCHSCNQSKSHTPWEEWYFSQEFFSLEKYNKIIEWMKPDPPSNLFLYKPRRNNVS